MCEKPLIEGRFRLFGLSYRNTGKIIAHKLNTNQKIARNMNAGLVMHTTLKCTEELINIA